MKIVSFVTETAFLRKFGTILLALFMVVGFVCGIVCAAQAGSNCFLWMDAADCRVSIVGLLVVAALPFSVTALAVYYSKHIFLYIISFFRTFGFSYCVYGLLLCYGQGAWLLAFLLMFSSHCLLPLDCWIWLKYTSANRSFCIGDFLVYALVAIGVTLIDFFLVSPFLQTVILI